MVDSAAMQGIDGSSGYLYCFIINMASWGPVGFSPLEILECCFNMKSIGVDFSAFETGDIFPSSLAA